MTPILLVLCTVTCLSAAWLTLAYGIARERCGMRSGQSVQLQWSLTSLLFGYAAFTGWTGVPVQLTVFLLLIPAVTAAALYWRTDPLGAIQLARRYKRGWLDVALLRRPNTELKRRVRTKGR